MRVSLLVAVCALALVAKTAAALAAEPARDARDPQRNPGTGPLAPSVSFFNSIVSRRARGLVVLRASHRLVNANSQDQKRKLADELWKKRVAEEEEQLEEEYRNYDATPRLRSPEVPMLSGRLPTAALRVARRGSSLSRARARSLWRVAHTRRRRARTAAQFVEVDASARSESSPTPLPGSGASQEHGGEAGAGDDGKVEFGGDSQGARWAAIPPAKRERSAVSSVCSPVRSRPGWHVVVKHKAAPTVELPEDECDDSSTWKEERGEARWRATHSWAQRSPLAAHTSTAPCPTRSAA
jgi:hypothetical protein